MGAFISQALWLHRCSALESRGAKGLGLIAREGLRASCKRRVVTAIVHNRAKVRTNLFRKSGLEAELQRFGAKELILPVVTTVTMLAIKRAEAKAGRKLSFAEVTHPEAGHLERMFAGEMQWAMQHMFPQYHALAELLLPPSLVPKEMSWAQPAEKPQPKQHTLNLEG